VPARTPKGVILLLCALFFFAATDAAFKYLAAFFLVPLLVWARFSVHFLIMLVAVAPRMGHELIITHRPGLMIARGLLLVVAAILLQLAFKDLPLAETTAIFFITPLLVALLAGPLLGEKLHLRTWLATLLGFAGVLLIVRPGGAMHGGGVAYTLAAALCNALYQILTRKLAQTEPVMRQLFYTALVGTAVMTAFLPTFWTSVMPTPMQSLLIVSLGFFAGIGHFLFIGAFRDTPASLLSPMTFFQLVWTSLLGWSVFDNYPDTLSTLGMLVICASGLSLALKWPRLEFSRQR
jgi:drug/metabolite transporter (DMT)-like permease